VPIQHDPERAELAAVTAFVPSFDGRRVLEIGCGDGRLTGRLAAQARSVTAIDPDERAIAECRDAVRDAHVTIRAVGLEDFIAPPHSYDIAVLSWSL
jgi:2-polyprenyl-3-methyl-5-hydroxy-6-metoxy-1,4-benzoquinol methylase